MNCTLTILLNDIDQATTYLLPATDLARHLNELDLTSENDEQEQQIDLFTIPAKRQDTVAIPIIATLQEAHEKMQSNDCKILYVTGAHGNAKKRIYGIITREHIDSSYQF